MTTLIVDHVLDRLTRRTARLKRAAESWARWRRRFAEAVDFAARGVRHVWFNRRYLTPIKLANMALINIQCKLKTERVVGMPYRMKIEPTNICNTKCQLCPTGIGLQGRSKGVIDFDRYAALVDALRRTLYTLDLSMWGDPLIVPDIYRMIRYAHDRGIWTYLSSNLHAFKPEKGQVEPLIRSGLDLMTCSLHGASQETYKIYQPGKQFDQAIVKIRAIQDAKRRLDSATPEIQLNFVVTRFNQHEIGDFQHLANALGCKAIFSNPSLNLRFQDRDKNLTPLSINGEQLKEKHRAMLDKWLPDNDRYVIEPYRLMRQGHDYQGDNYNGRKIMDCHWPWKDSVINWDGSVVTCCGVYDPNNDMGNVFEQPFHTVWNNRAYRMARRSFKQRTETPQGYANPCRDCPGFMV